MCLGSGVGFLLLVPPVLSLGCQKIRTSKLHPALRSNHCSLAYRAFPMALGSKQAGFRHCIFTGEASDLLKVTLESGAACLWALAPLCPLAGFATLGMVLPSLALSLISGSEFTSPNTLGSCDASSTPPVPSPCPQLALPSFVT